MTIPKLGTIIPKMEKKPNNLSDILFTKVRQRVLGLLYGQPDRDFFTNEIIRLTDIGTGAVQRELKSLTEAGLITIQKVGNQKRIQANQESPIYAELHSIVLKTFGLSQVLREALTTMAQQINIAFVYGSIAKHEATARSDIDVMIIGNELTYAEFFEAMSRAEDILGRKINPTFYSPADWKTKVIEENNFINKVMQQAKIFLIGNENELKKLK